MGSHEMSHMGKRDNIEHCGRCWRGVTTVYEQSHGCLMGCPIWEKQILWNLAGVADEAQLQNRKYEQQVSHQARRLALPIGVFRRVR